MWIYLLSFFLCFLFYLCSLKCKIDGWPSSVLLIALGFFLCFGYMTGTDWREYEKFYAHIANTDQPLTSYVTYEIGYWVYQKIFVSLKIDFWHFFILTKIILYVVLVKAIRQYTTSKYFWLVMTYFVPVYGFSLLIDNPMRNVIAIAIFLWSFKYVESRQLFKFILCTIIAMLFHYSAIILPLFYYLYEKQYKTTHIVIVYIIFNVIFISPTLIYGLIDFLFGWIPQIGKRVQDYSSGMIEGKGKMFSLGFISKNIIFILLMLFRKRIEGMKMGNTLFTYSVLSLFFYRLGLSIQVLGRFEFYLAVFFSIALVSMISTFSANSKLLYAIYIFIIALIPTVFYLRMDYRYIPYTNYLQYIGKKKMTYEERSIYNKIKSPYKDKINKK